MDLARLAWLLGFLFLFGGYRIVHLQSFGSQAIPKHYRIRRKRENTSVVSSQEFHIKKLPQPYLNTSHAVNIIVRRS